MINRIVVISLFLLASCSSQKVVFEKNSKRSHSSSYEQTYGFFLWGAFQNQKVLPKKICDNVENIESIEVKRGFEEVFFNFITGGVAQVNLYVPKRAIVYCKNTND